MSFEVKDALVSTDWLFNHLDDENVRILEISIEPGERVDGELRLKSGLEGFKAKHIPGAQLVDLLGDLTDKESDLAITLPSADSFAGVMSALGVGNQHQVVIYTRTYSAWATRLWWMFKAFGFERAAVLDGGFAKWEREAKPLSKEPTEPVPATFTATLNPAVIATLDEVEAAMNTLAEGKACLVDSLPADYFHGKAGDSYGYGRLGHIPGAVNVPIENLLDPQTGEYLSPEIIEEIFQQSLNDFNGRYITYCGGGIAASQNVFALHLIGKKDVAMYDGSLQEWVKDEARPLSTE